MQVPCAIISPVRKSKSLASELWMGIAALRLEDGGLGRDLHGLIPLGFGFGIGLGARVRLLEY